MKTDLKKAAEFLNNGEYTCVLCKGEEVLTSTKRGVTPLIDWIDNSADLKGFSAADKVVGKAAAILYVLLKVEAVYAPVMSEGAISVLAENGISAFCDKKFSRIINRTGDGLCPMEQAVSDVTDPEEGLKKIRERLNYHAKRDIKTYKAVTKRMI